MSRQLDDGARATSDTSEVVLSFSDGADSLLATWGGEGEEPLWTAMIVRSQPHVMMLHSSEGALHSLRLEVEGLAGGFTRQPFGTAVRLQAADGLCLQPAASASELRYAHCNTPAAEWTVLKGRTQGKRSLRVSGGSGQCLQRRCFTNESVPLRLGRCGGCGSGRWLLDDDGTLRQDGTFSSTVYCVFRSTADSASPQQSTATAAAQEGTDGASAPADSSGGAADANADADADADADAGADADAEAAAASDTLALGEEFDGSADGASAPMGLTAPCDDSAERFRILAATGRADGVADAATASQTLLLAPAAEVGGSVWERFVRSVVESQRTELERVHGSCEAEVEACSAARSEEGEVTAELRQNASSAAERIAALSSELIAAEDGKAACAEARRSLLREHEEVRSELASLAKEAEARRAAEVRAKAEAESATAKAAAAEAESTASAEAAGKLDSTLSAANRQLERQQAAAKACDERAAAGLRSLEGCEAARAEGVEAAAASAEVAKNASAQMLVMRTRALKCEARIAAEWETQEACASRAAELAVTVQRLDKAEERLNASAAQVVELTMSLVEHNETAAAAARCTEANVGLTAELGAARAAAAELKEQRRVLTESEAAAHTQAAVAKERHEKSSAKLQALAGEKAKVEQALAQTQNQLAEVANQNRSCASELEQAYTFAEAARGDVRALFGKALRQLVAADVASARAAARIAVAAARAFASPGADHPSRAAAAIAAAEAAASASAAAAPPRAPTWLVPFRPVAYATVVSVLLLGLCYRRLRLTARRAEAAEASLLELQRRTEVERTLLDPKVQQALRAAVGGEPISLVTGFEDDSSTSTWEGQFAAEYDTPAPTATPCAPADSKVSKTPGSTDPAAKTKAAKAGGK